MQSAPDFNQLSSSRFSSLVYTLLHDAPIIVVVEWVQVCAVW